MKKDDYLKKNFIVTKDKNAVNILLAHKLNLVNENQGLYTFVNEPKKLTFQFEKLAIRFTNKLYF